MTAKTRTVALSGMEGIEVEIETDIMRGLPYFNVIGLADASVKEASERVRRAIVNSDFEYPKGRITVNLSPAYIHKKGSHYDLGIAMGILTESGVIRNETRGRIFVGELALDGRILPVKGILPMIAAVTGMRDVKEILMHEGNCEEAYLITRDCDIDLIPVKNLRETVRHICDNHIEPYKKDKTKNRDIARALVDFCDIKGHEAAKEAIITALAGGHNLLMIGAPGTGKTMLAKRIAGVLPPMNIAEQIETSKIYSYAGMLTRDKPAVTERPFRHITPAISKAALLGGGTYPMPGEISFAHNGVLFADEMLEFPQNILEALRIPMEEKQVRIVRKGNNVTFPSNFIFVGAANPCRCGYLGDELRPCTCTQAEIDSYRNRLSGALAERMDICIEVSRAKYEELEDNKSISSADMRRQIERAKEIQEERFMAYDFSSNGDMDDRYIGKFCVLGREEEAFMRRSYTKCGISPRRYYRILKVARTIADLKGSKDIHVLHLTSAFHYTRFLEEAGESRNNYNAT